MAEDLEEGGGEANGTRPSDANAHAEAAHFSLAGRVRSFGFAGAGLALVIRTQQNAWIHALATVLVLGLAAFFSVSRLEWCALIISIAIVWSAESMNTALELLADAVNGDPHPLIGRAKDAAAGAVLVVAAAAATVGFIVLGPYCLAFLRGTG